jgi:hypothetical protein
MDARLPILRKRSPTKYLMCMADFQWLRLPEKQVKALGHGFDQTNGGISVYKAFKDFPEPQHVATSGSAFSSELTINGTAIFHSSSEMANADFAYSAYRGDVSFFTGQSVTETTYDVTLRIKAYQQVYQAILPENLQMTSQALAAAQSHDPTNFENTYGHQYIAEVSSEVSLVVEYNIGTVTKNQIVSSLFKADFDAASPAWNVDASLAVASLAMNASYSRNFAASVATDLLHYGLPVGALIIDEKTDLKALPELIYNHWLAALAQEGSISGPIWRIKIQPYSHYPQFAKNPSLEKLLGLKETVVRRQFQYDLLYRLGHPEDGSTDYARVQDGGELLPAYDRVYRFFTEVEKLLGQSVRAVDGLIKGEDVAMPDEPSTDLRLSESQWPSLQVVVQQITTSYPNVNDAKIMWSATGGRVQWRRITPIEGCSDPVQTDVGRVDHNDNWSTTDTAHGGAGLTGKHYMVELISADADHEVVFASAKVSSAV